MAPPKLYTSKISGNCYKVRLLAALLNIEVELIEVEWPNEVRSPEFQAINPRSQLPFLVDGDKTFADSSAILVYLAGTTKTPSSFWSHDVSEQAAIVDWLAFDGEWIQNGIATARVMINFHTSNQNTEIRQQALAKATTKGHKSLEILQKRLETSEWLALGRPTIADVAVFAYTALAPMGNISLDGYPAVTRWISGVRNLPGFIPIDG